MCRVLQPSPFSGLAVAEKPPKEVSNLKLYVVNLGIISLGIFTFNQRFDSLSRFSTYMDYKSVPVKDQTGKLKFREN